MKNYVFNLVNEVNYHELSGQAVHELSGQTVHELSPQAVSGKWSTSLASI